MADTKYFSDLAPLPAFDSNKVIAVEDDPKGTGGWKAQTSTDDTFATPSDAKLATQKAIATRIDRVDDKITNGLQHPTGFENDTDSEILYNSATQQITVQPKAPATSFNYYLHGVKHTISSPQSLTHTNATGVYYFYWDSSNTLQFTTSFWDIRTDVLISYAVYNLTLSDGFSSEERHSSTRNPEAHLEFHNTVGTYVNNLATDFLASGYTISPVGPTDADNTFSLTSGIIADEDIFKTLSALADGGPYTALWRTGSGTEWQWDKTLNIPFKSGTYIQYNHVSASNWILSDLTNGEYVNIWVLKTPSLNGSFETIIITPQNKYANLAGAQGETVDNLNLEGLFFEEYAAIYKFTYRTSAAYTSTGKVRIENVERLSGRKISITQTGVIAHNATTGKQLAGAGVTYGHVPYDTDLDIGTGLYNGVGLKNTTAAHTYLNFDPITGSIGFDSYVEFFKNVNSLSNVNFRIYKGNGTPTITCQINAANGDINISGGRLTSNDIISNSMAVDLLTEKTPFNGILSGSFIKAPNFTARSPSAAYFRAAENDSATYYTQLSDNPTYAQLKKIGNGATVFDIDAIPLDGTSASRIRFNRNTNTTSSTEIYFYKGDGTLTITSFISCDTGTYYVENIAENTGGLGVNIQGINVDETGADSFRLRRGTTDINFSVGCDLDQNVSSTSDVDFNAVTAATNISAISGTGFGVDLLSFGLINLESAGIVASNINVVGLLNKANAASMTATETSILYRQYYYDVATPAAINLGTLTFGTETNWTSTASTQDGYFKVQVAENGSLGNGLKIDSDKTVNLYGNITQTDGTINAFYTLGTSPVTLDIGTITDHDVRFLTENTPRFAITKPNAAALDLAAQAIGNFNARIYTSSGTISFPTHLGGTYGYFGVDETQTFKFRVSDSTTTYRSFKFEGNANGGAGLSLYATLDDTSLKVNGSDITINGGGTSFFISDRGATSNFNGLQLQTGSVEKWSIGGRNDATEDLHFFNATAAADYMKINATSGKVTLLKTLTISGSGITTGHSLEVTGPENDGTNAALKVSTDSQTILCDGNEFDCMTGALYIQANNDTSGIQIVRNGGQTVIGPDPAGGFGTGICYINQDSTTAAIPALEIQQDDISEGYINYKGSTVDADTGTPEGAVLIEINGSVKRMNYYPAPA